MIRSCRFVREITPADMNGDRRSLLQLLSFFQHFADQFRFDRKILPDRRFDILEIEWTLPEPIEKNRILEARKIFIEMKMRFLVNVPAKPGKKSGVMPVQGREGQKLFHFFG